MTNAAATQNDDDHDTDAQVPVLAAGAAIAPGYQVVEHLRRGEALDVYEVFSSERLCNCIAKTIRPDRAHLERVRNRLLLEGRLLQTLQHPMLLRGFETIAEPDVVVIAELLTGPTLDDLLDERTRRLPVAELCHLGRHLAAATRYLHNAGYLHLDIRPSNIIADTGLARLIDLSLARPPGPVPQGLGSEEYMAPEQARGGTTTAATDVWGIGVTLYEATTDIRPFDPLDQDEETLLAEVHHLQLHRPAPPLNRWRRRLPASFVSLIHACLDPDPEKRPGVVEVWQTLGDVLDQLQPVNSGPQRVLS
ncbi:MAG: Protein kinase domain [Propionibacteriaceae bacterium]|nr:Protein kinase domain [Propionibacteriaceae bacterium]